MIDKKIKSQLDDYIVHNKEPDSLTYALLANDFMYVIKSINNHTIKELDECVKYMMKVLPPQAWGSDEKIVRWRHSSQDDKHDAINRYMISRDANK